MALPNGRILGEVMPLLQRIGIEPEPAFSDPASRQLRFRTSDPGLDLIRVRSFDVATSSPSARPSSGSPATTC